MDDIRKLSARYVRQSIIISAALTIVGLIVMQVWYLDVLLIPIIVSAIFSLIVDGADGYLWRVVAEKSPESITTYHSSLSGFRMLLALVVMLVYYLIDDKDTMLEFFLVFMTYYVALMTHHVWFFTRILNRS